VIVVDAGGGATYALQPAVDAADDGDTLLVKSGTYAWFAVSNKAIAIVGDAGALVHINGAVRVRNLAAGRPSCSRTSARRASHPMIRRRSTASTENNQGECASSCDFTGVSHGSGNVGTKRFESSSAATSR